MLDTILQNLNRMQGIIGGMAYDIHTGHGIVHDLNIRMSTFVSLGSYLFHIIGFLNDSINGTGHLLNFFHGIVNILLIAHAIRHCFFGKIGDNCISVSAFIQRIM